MRKSQGIWRSGYVDQFNAGPKTSQIEFSRGRQTAEELESERKTVTALFAGIKGSMELMEGLDPEEARAIVDPALQLPYGSTFAKFEIDRHRQPKLYPDFYAGSSGT